MIDSSPLADGVAVRLALLCRAESGTLLYNKLIDAAVRCALLCDLAFAGRITDEVDGIEVDVTETGFAAADAVLRGIDERPGRTLDEWFAEGPALREVSRELLRSGRWVAQRSGLTRARRFVDPSGASRVSAVAELRSALVGPRPLDEVAATTVLLAHHAGLIDQYDLLKATDEADRAVGADQCGAVSWLMIEMVDYLQNYKIQLSTTALAGNGGGFS